MAILGFEPSNVQLIFSFQELYNKMRTYKGSLELQQILKDDNAIYKKELLNVVLLNTVNVVNHPNASFLVLLLLKKIEKSDLYLLTDQIKSKFELIAKNVHGTHVVQYLLDQTGGDQYICKVNY